VRARARADAPDASKSIDAVSRFLARPDRRHSFADWLRMLVEEMLVIDAATIYPRFNRGGSLYSLDIIDGATIKPLIGEDGRSPEPPDPAYQQILKGVPAADFSADELIYLPRNVRSHRLYGMSPVYTGGLPAGIGEWLSSGTFVSYGDLSVGNGRVSGMLGNVGGQSLAFTAGSGGTNGTVTVTGSSCGQATAFSAPKVDVTVSGGAIVDVYPSASSTTTGYGITFPCAFTAGVTGGTVTTMTYGPNEGQAGIATFATDNNMMGDTLYDNSGEPGNPLFSVFANPANSNTSYFEPGLPVKTFGQAMGARVSG
jgi:hypothetical protein